jgi:hypothetical protein
MDRSLESLSRRPDVAREIAYYLEKIESVKTIDDFLKDDRLFKFAMKAYGLGEFDYAKAFMRKVLTEGIDTRDAFANALADGRYREFAEAFNFKRYADAATIFDRARQGTVDRYARQSLEEEEGTSNDNVRLALYFERRAGSIEGPFDILSDKALTQFIYKALGLPATTSAVGIDRQAAIIADRLDFETLKSPEGISKWMTRFAAMSDIDAPKIVSNSIALLGGNTTTGGFGIDLMLAIQGARRR